MIRPLYAVLAALVLGVLAASLILPSGMGAGVCFTASAVGFVFGMVFLFRNHHASPFFLLAAVFMLGAARTRLVTTPNPNDVSRWAGGPSVWVRGVVSSEVEPKPRDRAAFTLRAATMDDHQSQWSVSGSLQVFAPMGEDRGNTPLLRPGEEVWLRGKIDTPPGQTNPDGFDYRAFLARQGIHATLQVRRPNDIRPVSAGDSGIGPVQKAAISTRAATGRILAAHLPPNEAQLLGGLLLSLRSTISADMQDAFVRTGTVHILSVSGLHIAALAWVVRTLLGGLGLRKKPVALLTMGLLGFAVVASGGSAAAIRSVACATLVLAAPLFRRTVVDYVHLLAVAAFGLVFLDPLVIFDAGAQLSFAIVGFLLIVMPLVSRVLFPVEAGQTHLTRLFNRHLLQAVVAGVVAEAASAPLTIYHFNRFSFIAPLANVLIVPLSEALVAGGLAATAVSAFLPDFFTAPFWGLLHLGLGLLQWLVLSFGSIPHVSPSAPSPPVWFLWMYYFVLGGVALYARHRMGKRTFFAPLPAD